MKNERTLQEAARWHARLQGIDCTDAQRDAFRQWLQQGPDQAQAYELASRVDAGIEHLAREPQASSRPQLSSRLQALTDEAFAAYPQPAKQDCCTAGVRSRRWQVPAALAASVAIAVVALRFSGDVLPHEAIPLAYETAAHEQRIVTLDDSSVIRLDVGTRLTVRMSPQRRQIELLSGRALFEVAHDASRPFSVTAAGARTTALGTQFQVERAGERVVVTLAEGSVAIDDEDQRRSGSAWQERLRPGEQLSFDAATATRNKQLVDPQIVTSWTHGRHVFRGTPLHEALAEVNRYATKKVLLGDPALADLPVGGNFIAGDSEVVVAAFAAVLPLRIVEVSDSELILFRLYEAQPAPNSVMP